MNSRRLRSLLMIAVFDIAGPLVAYRLACSDGLSTVSALVLSGIFPAVGVIIGIIKHHRVDTLGILVLAGIVLGTIAGLVSHDPKLVLDEGSVTTTAFGLACLGSLATSKPLMYRLALELMGPDSPRGREFAGMMRYKEFRHLFRVITVFWGVAFLMEAVARVIIVQNTSAGTALAVSNSLPFVVAGLAGAWTAAYGVYHKRRGERLAAAEAAVAPSVSSGQPAAG